MEITIVGVGMLSEYFPSRSSVVDVGNSSTVRDLLDKLRIQWGEGFYSRIIHDNKLAPYVIALHNGLSIDMKDGLNTKLADGDRLVFAISVNGG